MKRCNGLNHKQRRAIIKHEKRRILRIENAKLQAETKNIICIATATSPLQVDYELENEIANKNWLEYEEKLKNCDIKSDTKDVEDKNIQSSLLIDNKESEIEKLLSTIDEELQAWHNPFAPENYEEIHTTENLKLNDAKALPVVPLPIATDKVKTDICSFFEKVGACRFKDECLRIHNYPNVSCTILFRSMFNIFEFKMSTKLSQGMDVDLEYTDSDLYDEFTQFEDDVLEELKTYGKIIQFKVCCNREAHLQGNVYVQFSTEREAQLCFEGSSGRFYNKQLMQPQFVNITNWKTAICGLHYQKQICPHGRKCNFLHVFHSKNQSFRNADNNIFKQYSLKHRKSPKYKRQSEKHKKHKRSRSSSEERHKKKKSKKKHKSKPKKY